MAPALGFAWRLAALGGLAVGLALSPMIGGPARDPELTIAAAVAAALLSATAPRGRAGSALGVRAWVGLVAAAALAAGLGIGSLRVAAIDAGALRLAPGGGIEVGGFVTAVPRRARGMVRARIATPAETAACGRRLSSTAAISSGSGSPGFSPRARSSSAMALGRG